MSYAIGFAASAISILGYGTTLIPIKRYNVADGMFYQYMMCSAIWICGLIVQLVRNSTFEPFAILGGAIWTTGNILIFKISDYIGLGLGMLLWGSSGMIMGWSLGFFGILGVNKQAVSSDIMNISGIIITVFAIIIMFFVKKSPITSKELPSITNLNNIPIIISKKKRITGYILGLFAGALFGVNMTPSQYLVNRGNGSDNLIDYLFSHYCGIYASATFYFICYSLYRRGVPIINTDIVLPSFLSGIIWAIANISSFIAINELKYIITSPILSIGPAVISNLCMILLFKEIEGKKNYILLGSSILLSSIGIMLIILSLSI
jgi:glucose uptake protein GlcU